MARRRDALTDRLWRVRRRHDHIDAILRRSGTQWELRFVHNDRVLLTRRYARRDLAHAEANSRLRELERAGWNTHW
jgi:hypothetical protein